MSLGPFTTLLVAATEDGADKGKVHFYNDQAAAGSKIIKGNFTRPNTAEDAAKSGAVAYRNGKFITLAEDEPNWSEPFGETGCAELVVNPSRKNYIFPSNDFTDSAWSKPDGGTGSEVVITSNYAMSPDGTMNADRAQFNLNGGTTPSDFSFLRYENILVTAQNNRSIFLKSNTGASFDLLFGSNRPPTAFKKITVTGEWQRFDVNLTPTGSDSDFYLGLRNLVGINGFPDSADVLIWQAQLEEGNYPTDIINTTTSSVTRSDEKVTLSDIISKGLISATEGTFVIKINSVARLRESSHTFFQLGTTGNRIYIYISTTSDSRPGVFIQDSGESTSYALTTDNSHIALTWGASGCIISVNGNTALSTSQNLDFSANSDLVISGKNGKNQINLLKFSPFALTETELNNETL